jgi:general secretion pathway protein L
VAGTLFIRLQGESVAWRVDEAGGAGGEHDLSAAAEHARGRTVAVLVPVTDCPLFAVKLPTRNRARMLQAIPYALEDKLSEDVDDLHFAAGKPDADGQVSVAVVAHARIEEWLSRLAAAGLHAQRMIPDVLSLPTHPGAWAALLEPKNLLLRQGPFQGLALDTGDLGTLLPLAFEQVGDELPDRLHLVDCSDTDAESRSLLPPLELQVEVEECGGTPLHHLISGYDRHGGIDLLQGRYSHSERAGRLWRTWRIAAIPALLWLTLSILSTALDNRRLAGEELALRQQITEVYRQTFPNDRHIVDPRLQMQRKLSELQQGGGPSGGAFLSLLAKTATPLATFKTVKLGTVRYKQGRLDLELDLPSLQTLDQLKTKLEAGRLEVKIRNARSREGKVEGRLEIRESQGGRKR